MAYVTAAGPAVLQPTDTWNAGELAAGSVVENRYRLDSQIGEGGMGTVWLATDLALGRPVAVKVIRDGLAGDVNAITRVLLEARAIAQFRGENVVRVLDVGRLPSGAPYIVMEYLEGNDLFEELTARGPLPMHESVELVLQACEGLAEAHAEGIVHRDLKPENLFLSLQPNGNVVVKLIDFGVSKRMQSATARSRRLTQKSTFVGSPQYTAPEQMRSVQDIDQRADIWSLGTILYEILTGVSPFEAASTEAVCVMVMTEAPPPVATFRKDVPAGLERVITKCLEKERDRRYATVAELAADLARFGGAAAAERVERIRRVLSKDPPSRPASRSTPPAGRVASRRTTRRGSATRDRSRRPAVVLGALLAVSGATLAAHHARPVRVDAAIDAGSVLIEQAQKFATKLLRNAPAPSSEHADDLGLAPSQYTARVYQPAVPVVLTARAEPQVARLGSSYYVPRSTWQRPRPAPEVYATVTRGKGPDRLQ